MSYSNYNVQGILCPIIIIIVLLITPILPLHNKSVIIMMFVTVSSDQENAYVIDIIIINPNSSLACQTLPLQARRGSGIMPYAVLLPPQKNLQDNQIAELHCIIMCH